MNPAIAKHLVARLNANQARFDSTEYSYLWNKFQAKFPDAIACVLMPNHIHLVVAGPSRRTDRILLGQITQGFSLRFSQRRNCGVWEKIPLPQAIPNPEHLARQLRYVHLNPCRAGLCSDPLQWKWSTHRDLCGLTLGHWPNPAIVSRLVPKWLSPLGKKLHRYVSADPSCAVNGSPFPISQESQIETFLRPKDLKSALHFSQQICRNSKDAKTLAAQILFRSKMISRLQQGRTQAYFYAKQPHSPTAWKIISAVAGDSRWTQALP